MTLFVAARTAAPSIAVNAVHILVIGSLVLRQAWTMKRPLAVAQAGGN